MSGQIFISYRREDTEGYTGRLYDRLHERLPQNKIFMDVDSIEPGVDFAKAIEASVASCDVLVANGLGGTEAPVGQPARLGGVLHVMLSGDPG
jgi:hypothetical protein